MIYDILVFRAFLSLMYALNIALVSVKKDLPIRPQFSHLVENIDVG